MRRRVFSIVGIIGIVVVLIGLALAIGSIDLVTIGGSLYYPLAGIGLIASGTLILLGRPLGFGVYAAILLLTLLWSLTEVSLDGWALVPRLVAPAVLGLWISLPWVAGRLGVDVDQVCWWRNVGDYSDDYIRAIDERSGRILWQARLPAGGQATPAVYQGRDGREYVVISARGHGWLGTRNCDADIAYALPRG